MPQLDSASFFSQYVWLVIFFFGFHFLLATSYLPKIAKILKVRELKSVSAPLSSSNFPSFSKSHENSDLEPLVFAQKTVRESLQEVSAWLNKIHAQLKENSGKTARDLFIDKMVKTEYKQKCLLRDYNNIGVFATQKTISENAGISSIQNRAKSHLFITQKALSIVTI